MLEQAPCSPSTFCARTQGNAFGPRKKGVESEALGDRGLWGISPQPALRVNPIDRGRGAAKMLKGSTTAVLMLVEVDSAFLFYACPKTKKHEHAPEP